MMYSEFIEGTGCKVNEHNYKVFCNLEAMYMNTDMSKQEIYEYGKKLVDNSKSEAELKFEAEVKEELASLKEEAEENVRWIKADKESIRFWAEMNDDYMVKLNKGSLAYHRDELKRIKNRIAALKWVLES